MILSIISKVAFGVLIGGILGNFFTGDSVYAIVWATAIPVFVLSSLFYGLYLARRDFPGGATPGFALARVETAQRTGKEQAQTQELDVRLTVAAAEPYTTSTRIWVKPDNLRNFSAGTIVVVTRFGAERPDVTVVAEPPQEWQDKAAAAQLDPSVIPPASAAPAWETGTTTTPGTKKPRRKRATASVLSRVVAVSIIVAAAAVTLIPAYGMIGRTASNIARGDWDGNNMQTGSYQQLAVDEIAAVAGHYDFTSIYFHDDYVIASGLTRAAATTVDEYMYRYGRAFRTGPDSIQPTDVSAEVFDAEPLDFSIIAGLVERTVAETPIEGLEYVTVYVSRVSAGPPLIHIYLSGAYEDVSFEYDFDGRDVSAG